MPIEPPSLPTPPPIPVVDAPPVGPSGVAADRCPSGERAANEVFGHDDDFIRGTTRPGFMTSAAVHLLALILLAIVWPLVEPDRSVSVLRVAFTDEPEKLDVLFEPERPTELIDPTQQMETTPTDLKVELVDSAGGAGQSAAAEPINVGFAAALQNPLMRGAGRIEGAFAGREPENRRRLSQTCGGTPDSESAVDRALRWLAAHQRADGSWRFSHRCEQCPGLCRNPGDAATTTGATAVALLPFLGAGHTHLRGEYKSVVDRGVKYLLRRMLSTPHGGDLREGTMYAHGLATIALCEAYGMTRDEKLREPAQWAVDFIVYAQDHHGGGWRYTPGQPGDTTVFGWQLMALKSAQMAYLKVPRQTLYDAERFLNSVQSESGARYGYLKPGAGETTSAVGLLCRLYLGWSPDGDPLRRGVRFLAETGPSSDNMYFNYYATQVLHHVGGQTWEKWNDTLRDHLVARQATRGHESGSWYFAGGRLEQGGRLLSTSLSCMTLEVYYRYMPLYGAAAIDGY